MQQVGGPPAAMRGAATGRSGREMRTWLITAPPFCARPAMSRIIGILPSTCAAMPRMAPMVRTPVPADPGQRKVPRPVDLRQHGFRQRSDIRETRRRRPCAGWRRYGHEGRAEALEAGIVLVAGRLVDAPLAAEVGLQRLDGDAVRLNRTVAAALADLRVDPEAQVGVRHRPACGGGVFRRRRSARRR
jgi:hypothetical protein